MKTIEVSTAWNLEDWDYYLEADLLVSTIDLTQVRDALDRFKRIMLKERTEDFETWFYSVPEREWNLLVLSQPASLEMFEVVDDENNIN